MWFNRISFNFILAIVLSFISIYIVENNNNPLLSTVSILAIFFIFARTIELIIKSNELDITFIQGYYFLVGLVCLINATFIVIFNYNDSRDGVIVGILVFAGIYTMKFFKNLMNFLTK